MFDLGWYRFIERRAEGCVFEDRNGIRHKPPWAPDPPLTYLGAGHDVSRN